MVSGAAMRNLDLKNAASVIKAWEDHRDIDTWESEGGPCLDNSDYKEQLKHTQAKFENQDPYVVELYKFWSKCPFCGATNGKFGSVPQQHRPRCQWLGDAGKFDVIHPNYSKMIKEDNTRHLSMMHAKTELESCKRELNRLKKI